MEIVLPSLPPEWEEYPVTPGYILSYTSPEDLEMEIEVPASAETVTVTLEKGNNKPVLFTPGFHATRHFLKPAGALFPLQCNEQGQLPLTWDDGFLADLFLSLDTEEFPIEHLGGTRFSETIGEKGEGDPWSLDKERIVQTLRFYSFREDYISRLPDRALEISLSRGWYLWNNLLLAPFYAETAGVYTFEDLYEGEHILFPMDGSEPVRAVITEDEWFIFYPEYVESGNW